MDSSLLLPLRDEDKKSPAFLWGGLVIGTLLLGDGMRRFISPQSERDLYAFFGYIALGFSGLFMAGYRRAFVLDDMGLLRETSLWGNKKYRLELSWEGIKSIRVEANTAPSAGCFAYLADEKYTWRFAIQGSDLLMFVGWVSLKRPDLAIQKDEDAGD